MSGSNITVNKVFAQFWSETTSQKKQLQENSDSDSDIEEQKKRKKKRQRKKNHKRVKKTKPQSAFEVRHHIPMESVDEESHPEIQCVELNFNPNDENKEELIASTQFFNSRNKKRQSYDHVSPYDWPVVRNLIQADAPSTFDINAQNKRSGPRPYMEAVTRKYEESYLRPPNLGERPCLRGNQCEGLKIICENDNAFILTEFFLPSKWKKIQETGRRNPEGELCLMCKRSEISRALLNTRADRKSIREGVTLQDYFNLVNLPGEYDIKNCICSSPSTYEGLLEPIVLHQQCAYRLVEENGMKRYVQWKYNYPSNQSFQ
jgi:hypothetical protein